MCVYAEVLNVGYLGCLFGLRLGFWRCGLLSRIISTESYTPIQRPLLYSNTVIN